MKKEIKIITLFLSIALFAIISLQFASAANQNVCCEKTDSGLYCQNVPASECADGSRQAPTSCQTTSFCKSGTCYSSTEGTCQDNTPKITCNNANGTWTDTSPPQCALGCCVLGDQAAFVTLVRCKKLSSFLGLETNYDKSIKDEVQCVLSVQNQDKGACVYESEFEKTCKFTTRAECSAGTGNITAGTGTFYNSKLCSAEELGTNCGPTTKTTCLPGKDEVYFVDSCGNVANIYDASKINDKEYWSNVKTKAETCGANSANQNSKSCGNCNYLLGSICRQTASVAGATQPSYGDNICADLNCKSTSNGNSYKHGESWCVYTDNGDKDKSSNTVGSRFYKHICINGEEVLEQCDDFRGQACIENTITTSQGSFSQAACRVNRWQDCLSQTTQTDCENTDKRDCIWNAGNTIQNKDGSEQQGVCLPQNTPGLKFWDGTDAQTTCSQGNAQCVVTFEKGIFGGETCKKDGGNCECLDDSWTKQKLAVCEGLGDCGGKVNWIGAQGFGTGYKKTITDLNTSTTTDATTPSSSLASAVTAGRGGF